jgi:hypothetical protein
MINRFKNNSIQLKKSFWYTVRLLKNIDLNISVAILSLFVSYLAYRISEKALSHADEQFKLNSESSDKLFRVQLKHSKDLNDNLISQIRELICPLLWCQC